jgi:hypothetical protein
MGFLLANTAFALQNEELGKRYAQELQKLLDN